MKKCIRLIIVYFIALFNYGCGILPDVKPGIIKDREYTIINQSGVPALLCSPKGGIDSDNCSDWVQFMALASGASYKVFVPSGKQRNIVVKGVCSGCWKIKMFGNQDYASAIKYINPCN